ncbi:endolytic transglycosylase MltG, partial [bacterium]|nr:endolytic transglycosylase MltG [bacterium]
DFLDYLHTPMSNIHKKEVFTIEFGDKTEEIIDNLKRENLITKSLYFKIYLLLNKKKLKAGEYDITTDLTPIKLAEIFTTGKPKLHKLVILEGFTIYQIASQLDTLGITSKYDFIELAENFSSPDFPSIPENLEGYLFPDTYYFPRKSSPNTVIKTMLKKFQSVISEFSEDIEKSHYTLQQLITIASIIEKETSYDPEKQNISSVIHNRLQKNMLLQCDPTLIFAIGDRYDGNIRLKDKKIDSPYNTYRYFGLPPGPICNPGKNSIHSAIYPEDSPYLYFVSKNDGTHYFSKTLKEHNCAVYKYQITRNQK